MSDTPEQITAKAIRDRAAEHGYAMAMDTASDFAAMVLAAQREAATVTTHEQLDTLPQLSVVQFRGAGLDERNRLVWQLDGEWFSTGDSWSLPSHAFPSEAFPAHVLWRPDWAAAEAAEGAQR